MKLYKLNQGSTFENLKHFIYITNEYGVPSSEFVDAFIDQFGKVILNGNFSLNQYQLKQLEDGWKQRKAECITNKVPYREEYGGLFYTVLCQKAILKLKEEHTEDVWRQLSEDDKKGLLKQFILDFDSYTFDIPELSSNKSNSNCKSQSNRTNDKYSYKLISDRYLGHELTITESVNDIDSTYKAKVIDDVNIQLADTNLVVNINKFIEEVEDRNITITIKMGFFRFEDIYREG